MATEKFFVFNEDGALKRLKGRIVRFLDNEDPSGSDKSAIRTSLEVSPDAEGLVQADVGTAPNEIPVNGMLGDLAYQSAEAVSAGTVSADSLDVEGQTKSGSLNVYDSNGNANNSLDLTYNGSSGVANIQADSSGGNTTLTFGTSSSGVVATRWTINSSGNLVASSGLGIDFGSGASTTLSDYEIGGYDATLTPATSGTITVYTASDRLQYTRVGDLVSITGKITTTAVSSPVGDYVQLNVPFAIGNLTDSAGHFSGSCVIFNATGTMGNYSIIGIEGDSFVRIYKNTSNAASATAPDFSGNESVYVGFSYHTDA